MARDIGSVVCTQCCNGTLCNSGGCGFNAYPPIGPDVRGPVCFSCYQQATIDDCNTIRVCGRDEFCEVEAMLSPVNAHQVLWRTRCVHELAIHVRGLVAKKTFATNRAPDHLKRR
ncbi:hypothetical protein DPMN_029511 [Dreissena polymorpha]|uniref:Uncharacterized protein n=1 Tax=Dreissena polymorpha TaxID=45954 RepID=A0A9D4RH76_DREPO|nr:hypothetical protein DPMN_029511 [Dreissena polymorpha]